MKSRTTKILAAMCLLSAFLLGVSLGRTSILLDGATSDDAAGSDGVGRSSLSEDPGDPAGSDGGDPAAGDLEVLGAFQLPSDTDPNTFYVSPDGNDGNDGQTPETPWRDLDVGLRRIQAGHTLFVMDGLYERPLEAGRGGHFRMSTTGRADAWIRILAYPGATPTLRGTNGTGLEIVGSYVEVRGLELAGVGYSAENNFGMGIELTEGVNLVVADNIVHGFPIGGIALNGVAGVTVTGNTVYENGYWHPGQGSGISVWLPENRGQVTDAEGYTDRIENNIVFRNENRVPANYNAQGQVTDGNGIIIDSTRQTGYNGRYLVRNNLVVNNGGRAIHVFDADHVDIIHNTTYQNGFTDALWPAGSELTAYRASDVRFQNNIAWARPDTRPLFTGEDSNIVSEGNVYISGTIDGPATASDRIISGNPGIADPGLDPLSADFRLTAASMLIDTGLEPVAQSQFDLNGALRVQGSAPDPGAFEHGISAGSTPAPTPNAALTPPAADPNAVTSDSTPGGSAGSTNQPSDGNDAPPANDAGDREPDRERDSEQSLMIPDGLYAPDASAASSTAPPPQTGAVSLGSEVEDPTGPEPASDHDAAPPAALARIDETSSGWLSLTMSGLGVLGLGSGLVFLRRRFL